MIFRSDESIKSLEDYSESLVISMVSIATIESFHKKAIRLGILNEDEQECCTTIIWELRRLMSLLKTQAEDVFSRFGTDRGKIVDRVQNNILQIARDISDKQRRADDVH